MRAWLGIRRRLAPGLTDEGVDLELTGDDPGTVAPIVLALLYDEVAAELESQHGVIERLNDRAQQTLGFAAVILAIVAAINPTDLGHKTKWAFVMVVPIFGLVAWFAGRAWRFRGWRNDPDVSSMWVNYRLRDEETVRYQVIQNRLSAIKENEKSTTAKRRDVKRAQQGLYVGFAYLAVLIFLRFIQ